MKFNLNKNFIFLIALAAFIMLLLAMYEIFLKPIDTVTSSDIIPINTYFGEDVIEFLNTK